MTSLHENERQTPAPQVGRANPRPRSAIGQAGRLSLRATVPPLRGDAALSMVVFGQVKEMGAALPNLSRKRETLYELRSRTGGPALPAVE